MNINVNPAELEKVGASVTTDAGEIEKALNSIETAVNGLASWQSNTKNTYVSKLKGDMEKMREITAAVLSYGQVATGVANRINEIEANIAKTLNNNN